MILIVDDDESIRISLGILLRRSGYEVAVASGPSEALDIVRRQRPQLILMDMNFTGSSTGEDGLELLQKVRIFVPDVPVILITAWGSIPLAVEGMKLGACDFITKPWNREMLLRRIETAIRIDHPADGIVSRDDFDRAGIIGESPAMVKLLDTVRRVATTDAPVLITGENGTGKEMIAKAIHLNSLRRDNPFVTVNLGGIATTLFESEMFGHAKGAFTGAVTARKGRFELADKGTIFLDEIGDLELPSQVKLLRVLQEHTFEPLGDSRSRTVDIRVVSATNADLPSMLTDRTFREDLFYRINSITLHLPPLRERRDDIPLLVRHFASKAGGETCPTFSADAMHYLVSLPYPGNIRQLRNIVERAIIVSGKPVISLSDVEDANALGLETSAGQPSASLSGMTLEDLELKAIKDAMERHDGNLSAVAIDLGITRQSLYRRMEKYGLR